LNGPAELTSSLRGPSLNLVKFSEIPDQGTCLTTGCGYFCNGIIQLSLRSARHNNVGPFCGKRYSHSPSKSCTTAHDQGSLIIQPKVHRLSPYSSL
jgi:hypothetical protein